MKVTIRRIAEVANVSKTTANKVLHDMPGVSDEVRDKVKKIIDELNYKPNIIAKALNYQRNPLNICIIIPKEKNPYFKELKRGLDAAYKEIKDFGFNVEYYAVKDYDVDEQCRILEYLAEKKVSGVAIRGIDSENLRCAINKMVENNIPIITYDSDITNSRRLCFVGEDHLRSGRVAGELMSKMLDGQGKVAIVTGSLKVLGQNLRIQGFKSFLEEKSKDIKIVRIIETLEQEVIAYEKTIALLEDEKDLRGIFITAGDAKNVGEAVKYLKKSLDIKIVSYNFSQDVVELLNENVIDFTIGLNPYMQGYETMKTLFRYLFEKKMPKADHIITPINIGVNTNIDLF